MVTPIWAPILLCISLNGSDILSVWPRWLPIWKRRLFYPVKRAGRTGALAAWMSRAVNGFQLSSTAVRATLLGLRQLNES